MRADVGEAVAVNGETRLGTTQNQGVATLTVGAKADHRGPMFHNLEPVHPSRDRARKRKLSYTWSIDLVAEGADTARLSYRVSPQAQCGMTNNGLQSRN